METTAKRKTRARGKVKVLEKESLEAHVDLCAERYRRLEEKYQELKDSINESNKVIHERIDKVKESIDEHRQMSLEHHFKQNRILITTAVAVIVAIIGSIASHLMVG